MLPVSAFPNPLPFSRAAALEMLDRLESLDDLNSDFLIFVMIPIEERTGEWRFAGHRERLSDAFRCVGEFGAAIGMSEDGGTDFLRQMLGSAVIEVRTEPSPAPISLGSHRVILCGEGQAPYDDTGFCIVEIAELKGSGFADRLPETTPPEEWSNYE